jgi:hypothetical protein
MPISTVVQFYIDEGKLTPAQANKLTMTQRLNIESTPIRNLIANGALPFETVLNMNETQRVNLGNPFIHELLENDAISTNQIINLQEVLNESHCTNLASASVRKLIINGMLTFN